jgi:hypothetical protein
MNHEEEVVLVDQEQDGRNKIAAADGTETNQWA